VCTEKCRDSCQNDDLCAYYQVLCTCSCKSCLQYTLNSQTILSNCLKERSKATLRAGTSPSNANVAKPPEVISNEPLSENIALDCAINGDIPRLVRCFEDNADAYYEIVGSMVNKRSSMDGKSPLEWASLLGRTEIVTELLKRGAEINSVNCKGRLFTRLLTDFLSVHSITYLLTLLLLAVNLFTYLLNFDLIIVKSISCLLTFHLICGVIITHCLFTQLLTYLLTS